MTLEEIGRQKRKKLATRRRIFEAALKLFREKGYEATTIDDIALEADVAKTTFFKHFPRKYEIILEFLEKRRERIMAAASEEQIGHLSTKMQLAHILSTTVMLNESDPIITEIAMTEYVRSGDIIQMDTPIIELFYKTLERGKERGEIRLDVSSHVVARVLWAYYVDSLFSWVRSKREQPLGPMLLAGIDVIFEGIANTSAAAHVPAVTSASPGSGEKILMNGS